MLTLFADLLTLQEDVLIAKLEVLLKVLVKVWAMLMLVIVGLLAIHFSLSILIGINYSIYF